jgi:hypothetical protein
MTRRIDANEKAIELIKKLQEKHAHFTLNVIDALWVGGFSLETPLKKTFRIEYRIFTPEE